MKDARAPNLKKRVEAERGKMLNHVWLKKHYPDLESWLEEVSRFGRTDECCLIFNKGNRVRVEIATSDYIYSISARLPEEKDSDRGYLGCTCNARKSRFGETWTRGNDLHDGIYSKDTWHQILGDIVSMELERSTFAPKYRDLQKEE